MQPAAPGSSRLEIVPVRAVVEREWLRIAWIGTDRAPPKLGQYEGDDALIMTNRTAADTTHCDLSTVPVAGQRCDLIHSPDPPNHVESSPVPGHEEERRAW